MTTLTRSQRRAAQRELRRTVVATSTFNVASTACAGIAGILVARSVGPGVRGDYAAIMAWFGLLIAVGGLGQSAATTFHVARDPARAADYTALSRNMLIGSGTVILSAGLLAAPLLSSGSRGVLLGYQLMFVSCLASIVGTSWVFALQGTDISTWNLVRVCQPVGSLVLVFALHAAGHLTLVTAMAAFCATMVAQTALAYGFCARGRLTGGRARWTLAGPLARFGAGQLAITIPMVAMSRIDQLALALTSEPATLGNYAVAASLTNLAIPVAAGLGSVAFPRIAARRGPRPATTRLQRQAVAVSAGIGLALMLPLAAVAPWLVPLVFGAGFDHAAGLVFLLAPGGVFLASQQVCTDLLRGHGRPFDAAWAQAAAAGLMVVLLAVLMPPLGAAGAAIASSTAAGVAFLLLLRALNRALAHPDQKGPTP